MKHTKLLIMAAAALFASSAMAETEKSPTGLSTETSYTGISYNLPSIKGKGNKCGSMTTEGIKVANKNSSVDGKTKNVITIGVNEGYVINQIDFNGASNDNSKSITYTGLKVDGTEQSDWTSVELPGRGKSKENSKTFSITNINAEKTIEIITNGNVSESVFEFIVTYGYAKNIATLSSITIDGEALEGFDPTKVEYNVELPYGTTTVPAVKATANSSKAEAVVTPAASLPGATTIVVTAEDGTTTKTYTINFTISTTVSTDATLKEITVGGTALSDFAADKYEYAYTIEYGADYKVAATTNNAAATLTITQIANFGEKATIVVTAQDGTTSLTYTVTVNQAAAVKKLYEVVFSNGAKGAISTEEEGNYTVTVPYLSTEEVPTVATDSVEGKGAKAEVSSDGNSIVLTGADGATETYAIKTVALQVPTTLGSDTVTFEGSETDYIFAPYGFGEYITDAKGNVDYKGWKFAKSVNDDANRRISKGNTRIYMALPAAKEVALVSGTGAERPVRIYVNGVENKTVTKTAKYGEAITITLDSTKTNFLAIESNQTSGDGGFIKIKITPAQSTAIDNAQTEVKAVKVLRNGQLLIQKGDKTYTAQGTVVE